MVLYNGQEATVTGWFMDGHGHQLFLQRAGEHDVGSGSARSFGQRVIAVGRDRGTGTVGLRYNPKFGLEFTASAVSSTSGKGIAQREDAAAQRWRLSFRGD